MSGDAALSRRKGKEQEQGLKVNARRGGVKASFYFCGVDQSSTGFQNSRKHVRAIDPAAGYPTGVLQGRNILSKQMRKTK